MSLPGSGTVARVDITDIRRREILDAAYKVFADKGYHNAGMADIARELGVGHGTIYRYFSSKLDLATTVLQELIEKISGVVTAEPPEAITSLAEYRQCLGRIGDRFYALLEENPEVHRWLFYEALSIDESVTARINDAFDLFAAYTELYLRNGIERGFLRPDIHTRETSLAVNAMLFEAARRLPLAEKIDEDSKKVWRDTIVGLILDGLAA
jgi:AcrR family transcriptional regulator